MSAGLTLFKEDGIYQGKGQSPQVLDMWDDDKDFVSITIKEGKFHQIKRMFEAVDMKVLELYRYQMGSLILDPELELGQYRELDHKELNELKTGDQKNV